MQEKVEIIIEIDTAEVEEKLGQTAKSLNDLKERNKELRKGMKDGTADFQAASKEIALNNNEIKTLTSTQKSVGGSDCIVKQDRERIHQDTTRSESQSKRFESAICIIDRGAKEYKWRCGNEEVIR